MAEPTGRSKSEPPPTAPLWPEIYLAFLERTMLRPSAGYDMAAVWLWPVKYWSGCAAAWSSACSALTETPASQEPGTDRLAVNDRVVAAHILE